MSDKEKKVKKAEEETSQEVETKEEKKSSVEALEKELEEAKKKASEYQEKYEAADKEKDDWKNRYYEAYANISNLRKQVEKETADFKKYAAQSLIEELIPTLDSFDMALKNEPQDEKIKNYVQGFVMIHNKLLNSLKQLHVEIIDPKKGDEYDPHCMQAFSTVEGEEDNKIAEVFTKGYKLYDHLLRPSGVIVTSKAEKKEETKNEEQSSEEEHK